MIRIIGIIGIIEIIVIRITMMAMIVGKESRSWGESTIVSTPREVKMIRSRMITMTFTMHVVTKMAVMDCSDKYQERSSWVRCPER